MHGIFDLFACDNLVGKVNGAAWEVSLRASAEIHDNFNEILKIRLPGERILDMRRHDTQQEIEVVCDFLAGQFFAAPRSRYCYPTIMFIELHEEQDLGSL